jgi:hypothetical protein
MNGPERIVVVGTPGGRRETLFAEAVSRRGWPVPEVMPWANALSSPGRLAERVTGDTLVRLETPGESPASNARLLELGLEPFAAEGGAPVAPAEIAELVADPTRVVAPRQWYLGLSRAAELIARELRATPAERILNGPAELPVLFDKTACQVRFAAAGLPIPEPIGIVRGYDDLIDKAKEAGMERIMVKPRHASAAAGLVAIHRSTKGVRAITTVDDLASGPPVSFRTRLRPRHLLGEDRVAELIDGLTPAALHAERWVPKLRLDGVNVDARILVIGGRARFAVGRASPGPFTNLNLGSTRVSEERLAERLGPRWPEALALAERVAALFPGMLHLGVDVGVRPEGSGPSALFEANAFGDLLPGLAREGRLVHDVQLDVMAERRSDA